MRILIVVGTRPEAIKIAPIVAEFARYPEHQIFLSVTAQHRSMLDDVLRVFDLKPDNDLDVMKAGQSLNELTAVLLASLDKVIEGFNPDWVLIQGDTTTAFATALAAFYRRIRVAHLEAGLRTGRMYDPWPEESNRKLIASLAHRHYAPTERARSNLLREGISDDAIRVTGNSVIDALKIAVERLNQNDELVSRLKKSFEWLDGNRRLILVTGHRRESFGAGFREICTAIRSLGDRRDLQIVYPVHLNPNVRSDVHRYLRDLRNVHLLEPVDYLSFVYLMQRSHLILTDSGGVQEEAPWLGKPVLVMRNASERLEAVEAGVARLVTTNAKRIVAEATLVLDNEIVYASMGRPTNVFGDGTTASQVVSDLISLS